MHELLCGTQSIVLIRLLRVRYVVQKRIVGDGNTEKGFFKKGLILLWREETGCQGGNKESQIFHTNESTGKVLLRHSEQGVGIFGDGIFGTEFIFLLSSQKRWHKLMNTFHNGKQDWVKNELFSSTLFSQVLKQI